MRVFAVNKAIEATGAFAFLRVAERCSVNAYDPNAAPSRSAPASAGPSAVMAIATFLNPPRLRTALPAARRNRSCEIEFFRLPSPTPTKTSASANAPAGIRVTSSTAPVAPTSLKAAAILVAADFGIESETTVN